MHDGQSSNWISRDFQLSHDFLNHVMIRTWLLLTATAQKYKNISPIWMSFVTRMSESNHIYDCIMILTWLLLTATAREYKNMSNGRYGEPVYCSALCVLRCIVEHVHGACHGKQTYLECVMSHMCRVCGMSQCVAVRCVCCGVLSEIYMGLVTYEDESHVKYVSRVWHDPCHTNEWAMSHRSHIISNMYEWVMSHIWMSHVTHMSNGPCLACSITLICVTDTYEEPVCCSTLCMLQCIVRNIHRACHVWRWQSRQQSWESCFDFCPRYRRGAGVLQCRVCVAVCRWLAIPPQLIWVWSPILTPVRRAHVRTVHVMQMK